MPRAMRAAASMARRARASHRADARPPSVVMATTRSRCSRIPSTSPGAGSRHPPPGLELAGARSRRGHRRGGRGEADPSLGPFDVAELEQAHGDAAGGQELDGTVALEPGRPMGLLATGQRQVGHDLGPRVDVDPEEHLEVETVSLALGDDLGQAARHAPDLLEVPRRVREVHDRPVPRVGQGDDGRHDAGAVTEPLEDAEGSLEDLRRLDVEQGRSVTRG